MSIMILFGGFPCCLLSVYSEAEKAEELYFTYLFNVTSADREAEQTVEETKTNGKDGERSVTRHG